MKALKVPLEYAEEVKQKIELDTEYIPKTDSVYIYYPIKKDPELEYHVVNKRFQKRQKKRSFTEALDFLKPEEKKLVVKSYDVVGSIAIIDVPEALEKKEKKIAKALLETFQNIKTVLKKASIHEGEFRTQKMQHLAGEKTKETIHTENGCRIKLDVEKVYFSTRQANERLRIAKKIREGEDVLVLFSGAAPFALNIEKHAKPKRIVAIEKNPIGHKYAKENVELNKMKKIQCVNADVEKVKIEAKFDTVIMPLPKSADDFLGKALEWTKPKGRIFIYLMRHENDVDQTASDLKGKISWNGRAAELPEAIKCGDYAPGSHRYCYEINLKD